MLPDFPKTKKLINKDFEAFLKDKVKEYAQLPLSDERNKIVHEGDGITINYDNERSHDTSFKNLGGSYTVNIDEIMDNPKKIYDKLDELARTIAEKQGKMFIETISEVTEKFGQTTTRKGDPTAEDLLSIYEKVQITFNSDGTPNLPTIYCGIHMIEKMKIASRELFETDEFNKRFQQIINTKKQDWVDRENNRKLVD